MARPTNAARITGYLIDQGKARTVAQIAEALNLTAESATKALKVLTADKMVKVNKGYYTLTSDTTAAKSRPSMNVGKVAGKDA